MISTKRLILLLVPLALLAVGCATTSPLLVPVRPAPLHSLKEPPPARLRIPVVVSLPKFSDIEKHLADFVKEDLSKSEKSLVKSFGTTVWWDPMTWEADGNSLTAHLHIHCKSKNPASPGSDGTGTNVETEVQEMEKDLQVDLTGALKWTKDFHLEAPDFDKGDTVTARSEPDTDDKKAVNLLRKGTSKFHENLKKGTKDILDKAKELWVKIQEPIRMTEDTWLHVKPDQISVGSYQLVLDGPSPHLETDFQFIIQPDVVIGEKPRVQVVQLPPLQDYQPGPEGFHIETNLKISFKEVNKLLVDPKTGILNKVLPGGGNHNLKIDQLRLYGSGGQLVVEAQVEYQPVLNLSSQPAQLTIYLLGTPTYHEDQQLIDFPDMDFDIKTSDFLVQMADFISGSGMREQLRKQAIIPLGKKLDDLKQKLTQVLNRPLGNHARLKTTLTSLRMEEAFVSDYGIEGRVALDGDASVDVNW